MFISLKFTIIKNRSKCVLLTNLTTKAHLLLPNRKNKLPNRKNFNETVQITQFEAVFL